MKKILIPTDFSENARNSMVYAAQLFSQETVEFIIINTYDPPPTPAQLKSRKLSETILTDSLGDLGREEEFLSGIIQNSGTVINSLSRKGSVAKALKMVGKKEKADLIIMSLHGEHDNPGFGSNTLSVIKNSNLPVLIIPENVDFQPYKKVLFAADLQGYSKESLESPLHYLLKKFDSKVEVVHFGNDENEEKKRTMDTLVDTFGDERTNVHYIRDETVIQGLKNVIRNHKPDVLVLVDRHRWFFSQLFLKSVTSNIELESPVPILILHDKP